MERIVFYGWWLTCASPNYFPPAAILAVAPAPSRGTRLPLVEIQAKPIETPTLPSTPTVDSSDTAGQSERDEGSRKRVHSATEDQSDSAKRLRDSSGRFQRKP